MRSGPAPMPARPQAFARDGLVLPSGNALTSTEVDAVAAGVRDHLT